ASSSPRSAQKKTSSPAPIAAIVSPATSTCARATRCSSAITSARRGVGRFDAHAREAALADLHDVDAREQLEGAVGHALAVDAHAALVDVAVRLAGRRNETCALEHLRDRD